MKNFKENLINNVDGKKKCPICVAMKANNVYIPHENPAPELVECDQNNNSTTFYEAPSD